MTRKILSLLTCAAVTLGLAGLAAPAANATAGYAVSPTSVPPTGAGVTIQRQSGNWNGVSSVDVDGTSVSTYTEVLNMLSFTAPAGTPGTYAHITIVDGSGTHVLNDDLYYKDNQTIFFANPGTQNFGTSPTLSATADSGLTVTFSTATPSVCTVTTDGDLTFSSAGTCTIHADQVGDAAFMPAPQVSRSFSVNAVLPGAPSNVVATAGDTQASISFDAPASTGGSSITGYTVTVTPAHVAPVNGASSPTIVTGLTNGVSYTFTVSAENTAGTGPDSTPSNAVTPKQYQAITFANPGDQVYGSGTALVASSDAMLPVTLSSDTPSVCDVAFDQSLMTLATGTCTITATQPGNVSYLAATPVTRSFQITAGTPSQPLNLSATAGDTVIDLTWDVPSDLAGGTITGYTIIANNGSGNVTFTAGPAVTSYRLTGLTNDTEYGVYMWVTTDGGTSNYSSTVHATPVGGSTGGGSSNPPASETPKTYSTVAFTTSVGACTASTMRVANGTVLTSADLPSCSGPDGYVFVGWNGFSSPTVVTGNMTLNGKWGRTPGTLTLVNTKSLPESIKVTYAYDDSTPATTFVVVDKDGNLACSSEASSNTCTIEDRNQGSFSLFARNAYGDGVKQTFTVKSADREITLTGERTTVSGKRGVLVRGSTTGFAPGAVVVPFFRFPGQGLYVEGSSMSVGSDGTFTWSRKTPKKVYVYFESEDGKVKSNRLVISAS